MSPSDRRGIDILGRALLDLIVWQESQIFVELKAVEDQLRVVSEGMNRPPDMAALELPWIGGSTGGIKIR